MKAVMLMFDSLNRNMLEPYGCSFTHTPNFKRLAEMSVTFDTSYAGSLPCMPARRELHTGRYNFLHKCWGPLEVFDDSAPEILKQNGIYTHLISDHVHYWEDGGCNYHSKYNSWEIIRGQEGDPWKGEVPGPEPSETATHFEGYRAQLFRQEKINRKYMTDERDHPLSKTITSGINFIETNLEADNWFLQIECFDPHEPFFTYNHYKELYPHPYEGPHFDWPDYKAVSETKEQIDHIRYEYAALLSMCDAYLGKVLDMFDSHNLWKDTLLIVNTDHGYLLGEHGYWAKNYMPQYNEIANTPLFIWDPRSKVKGERRKSLVQTIDLPVTLLDFFGLQPTKDMQGKSIRPVIERDQPIREAGLFGIHGSHICCTDGRYVYMKAAQNPFNKPLYNYTLIPHGFFMFSHDVIRTLDVVPPFTFTKDCRLMRFDASTTYGEGCYKYGDLLFDIDADPKQECNLTDEALLSEMQCKMVSLMDESDCPQEQYERVGLKRILL